MTEIAYQHFRLAPLPVVRQVREFLPAAIDAVEAHMREPVPALIVTVAGPAGLATALLRAMQWRRARRRNAAAYWRHLYRESAGSLGCACVTFTDRVLIGLNGPQLRRQPEQAWPTLVHELAHAVQMNRTGRRGELRADLDANLRIANHSPSLGHAMDAVTAIEEAEAYAVQEALDPQAQPHQEFDSTSAFNRVLTAASCWKATAERSAPAPRGCDQPAAAQSPPAADHVARLGSASSDIPAW